MSERLVNQRLAPCPLEVRGSAAAWVDGRLHQWLSHAARAGRARGTGRRQRRRGRGRAGHHAGRRRRLRRQDRHVLRGAAPRPDRRRSSAARCAGGRRAASRWSALGHGRAQVQHITIGGTRDGKVLAYRLHVFQDCGACVEIGTILAPFMTRPMSSGVYAIPNIECHTTSVVTNTTPIVAYRGAGRPEATAAIERAMDLFAAEIGMDPVEVRRQEPDPQVRRAAHHRPSARRTTSATTRRRSTRRSAPPATPSCAPSRRPAGPAGDPKQLGIGVSVYVEITGGVAPARRGRQDRGARRRRRRRLHRHLAARPGPRHGVVDDRPSEQTGIPMDQIDVVWGDTDLVPAGGGTMGSRSLQQGGAAVHAGRRASSSTRPQELAAELLEADVADVVLDKDAGRVPRGRHARRRPDLGRPGRRRDGRGTGSARRSTVHRGGRHLPLRLPTSPWSRSTPRPGKVRHLRHVACDDAGRVLNPLLLEGQIHGGIAQGAAQALLEEVRYDEDGNPVTSNLADYAFISAAELPSFEVVHMETPTPVNPLGAKGIGESRHHRLDARRAVGRDRRAAATSASATSTCRRPPSGSGRPSRPPARTPDTPQPERHGSGSPGGAGWGMMTPHIEGFHTGVIHLADPSHGQRHRARERGRGPHAARPLHPGRARPHRDEHRLRHARAAAPAPSTSTASR